MIDETNMATTETIPEIVADIRKRMTYAGAFFTEAVEVWMERIEAAYKRIPILTPEQWTAIGRQGVELAEAKEQIKSLEQSLYGWQAEAVRNRKGFGELRQKITRSQKALHLVVQRIHRGEHDDDILAALAEDADAALKAAAEGGTK